MDAHSSPSKKKEKPILQCILKIQVKQNSGDKSLRAR